MTDEKKHDPLRYGGNKETEEWIRQADKEIRDSSIKRALREVYWEKLEGFWDTVHPTRKKYWTAWLTRRKK